MRTNNGRWTIQVILWLTLLGAPTVAQTPPAGQKPSPGAPPSGAAPPGAVTPAGFAIGVDDLLTVKFWGDAQLSGDVVVRPDGKISLPLINDVQAAGYTPEQLSDALEKAASKYITEPDATVIVREIRSRKVFVLGQGVARPGTVLLNTDMNVLQLLAAVGGLLEYADKGNIVIIRTENGRDKRMKFNFSDVVKGKNLQQNILLRPNDTVLVN
ncbi:MAG TPA: polysaccharide biosynthesis/export family protein [Vicinamibacterales bacterium]|nr:polysaccharide biosynthesis/export family protein [Vicinamibacterales bacterium]